MSRRLIIYLRSIASSFALLLTLCAAAEPDSLMNANHARLAVAEPQLLDHYFKMDMESGLDELHKLERWAETKGDKALSDYFQFLRFRVAILHKQKNNKYAEDGLLRLSSTIDQKNKFLQAEILSRLSDYYWDNQLYALAFEYGILGHKVYSNFKLSEYPHKTEQLHNLASRHYHFRDFENSRKYLIEIYKEEISVSSLNTLALCYSNLSRYDSALHYFNVAYADAVKNNNDVWIGILSGNIAHMYYLQKDYQKAVTLFEICVEKCLKHAVSGNAANAMGELSNVYFELGMKDKSYEMARRCYQTVNLKENRGAFDLIKNTYPKIARIYAAFGRSEEAFTMLDSAMMAKDSVSRRSNALIFAGVQHKMDAREHLEAQQVFEKEQHLQGMVQNGLIAGLVMLGVIAALLINRQRIKYRHQQEQLQIEKLQTQAELINAGSQLEDFMKSITEKNELLEKFSAEIHRMQQQYGSSEYLNAPLLELQKSSILSDSDWERFVNSFDKVHHGFMNRLKKKVQGLSPVETRFMLLSRLGLSNQEMASALGISIEAARQNRERLRNKLKLAEAERSLEEFAASI